MMIINNKLCNEDNQMRPGQPPPLSPERGSQKSNRTNESQSKGRKSW